MSSLLLVFQGQQLGLIDWIAQHAKGEHAIQKEILASNRRSSSSFLASVDRYPSGFHDPALRRYFRVTDFSPWVARTNTTGLRASCSSCAKSSSNSTLPSFSLTACECIGTPAGYCRRDVTRAPSTAVPLSLTSNRITSLRETGRSSELSQVSARVSPPASRISV